MCLLQRPDSDEKIIYASGDEGIVYAFFLESHEIIDMWELNSPISKQNIILSWKKHFLKIYLFLGAMDYLHSEKFGSIFAIGFKDGRIMLRYESTKKVEWYPSSEISGET